MRLDIVVNGALLAAGLGLAFWASKPADEESVEADLDRYMALSA